MSRLNIDILGLCEIGWPISGSVSIYNRLIYYSGRDEHRKKNGVRIIVGEKVVYAIIPLIPHSDCLSLGCLDGKH